MFAVLYILKGGLTALLISGFFISDNIIYGSEPPCNSVMELLPLRCIATGKAEPFCIFSPQTNFSKMLYTEKTCLKGKHSTRQATPNGAKTVSIRKFNIEKNAKNEAYAFILQKDLLNEFHAFHKATADVEDFHALCLSLLISKMVQS